MTVVQLTSIRAADDKFRVLRRVARMLTSTPATSIYVLVLFATTVVLSSSSAQSDNQLLLAVSTNLHQLTHDPIRVLIASAFWTSGWWDLALTTALFAAILAPVERRLGWRRTTIIFAAGHVGATLTVAGGLWIGIQLGGNPADVLARDVGTSYGFFAVAAVAGYLLAPRFRVRYFALTIGYVLAKAAVFHTFTDFGHATAIAIGLACYPLVHRVQVVAGDQGPNLPTLASGLAASIVRADGPNQNLSTNRRTRVFL